MSRGIDLAWSRLPDYVRAADDGTLYTWLGSLTQQLDPALLLLDSADPATSVSGTCEIANPDRASRAPVNWLGWLGWLVGVDTTVIPTEDVRDVLRETVLAQRRGSVDAIIAATRRTLTGSQACDVIVKPPDGDIPGWDYDTAEDYDADIRYDSRTTDPYGIIVITQTPETPDANATLLAALSEKPAGMTMELQVLDGMTYADLSAAYGTYDALRSTLRTYGNLATSFA